jgi:hypothetical protein
VFINYAVVEAFGEDKAKQLDWVYDVKLPFGYGFTDVACLDDLKFFEYGGTLCLFGDENHMERIYTNYFTADIIFSAEQKLKNKICEDEIKQQEYLLRMKREEMKKRIEDRKKLEIQNKELTTWWQELCILIKKSIFRF